MLPRSEFVKNVLKRVVAVVLLIKVTHFCYENSAQKFAVYNSYYYDINVLLHRYTNK